MAELMGSRLFTALDANGNPISGAHLRFYLTGTTTPQTVFQDATLTTPHATPVVCDSAGRAPDIYFSGSAALKVVIADASDVAIRTIDPFNTVLSVGTLTYTPTGSGAVSRTISSKLGEFISVKDFGAVGDGVTDDTAAVNLAIAYALTLVSGAFSNVRGCTIWFPDGKYKITGALTPITGSGITFRGESRQGANLLLSYANSTFTWDTAAFGGGLDNLTLTYPANPANTAVVVTVQGACTTQSFTNLCPVNVNTFLQVGSAPGGSFGYNINCRDIDGYAYNSGKPTFRVNTCAGLYLDGVRMYVNGVGVPTEDRVSTMTTVSGTNFIQIDGTIDTLIVSGSTSCNRYWSGIYASLPGYIFSNCFVAPTVIFDYCADDAIGLHAVTNASGGIVNITIKSQYIFSWSGNGIAISGDNQVACVDLSSCYVRCSGKNGISLAGQGTRQVDCKGVHINGSNRINGGYAHIRVAANTPGPFSFDGSYGEQLPGGLGLAWNADYGIDIPADQNYYSICGCRFSGAIKNYRIGVNTSNSFERHVNNNQLADYFNFQTTGNFVAPVATATTWFNWSPFTVQVMFRFLDDYVVNGQQIGPGAVGNTFGTVTLGPGESFTPYAAAFGAAQIKFCVRY
jgi:hypothetical protein